MQYQHVPWYQFTHPPSFVLTCSYIIHTPPGFKYPYSSLTNLSGPGTLHRTCFVTTVSTLSFPIPSPNPSSSSAPAPTISYTPSSPASLTFRLKLACCSKFGSTPKIFVTSPPPLAGLGCKCTQLTAP